MTRSSKDQGRDHFWWWLLAVLAMFLVMVVPLLFLMTA